jgi:hypothetical protein
MPNLILLAISFGNLVAKWNVPSLHVFEQHFVSEDEVNKIWTISAF